MVSHPGSGLLGIDIKTHSWFPLQLRRTGLYYLLFRRLHMQQGACRRFQDGDLVVSATQERVSTSPQSVGSLQILLQDGTPSQGGLLRLPLGPLDHAGQHQDMDLKSRGSAHFPVKPQDVMDLSSCLGGRHGIGGGTEN